MKDMKQALEKIRAKAVTYKEVQTLIDRLIRVAERLNSTLETVAKCDSPLHPTEPKETLKLHALIAQDAQTEALKILEEK